MQLTAITMVKDEIDIIEYTLRHLHGQGVDFIIVADNGSTDGTRELLDALEQVIPMKVVDDAEVGYYQSVKMSRLADMAREGGADWIIPFDADECWFATRGKLKECVSRIDRSGRRIAGARLFNHFPTSQDNDDVNPFRRIVHRDVAPAPLVKVAVKAEGGLVIQQGNHGATMADGYDIPYDSDLQVGHFPWRTFEQFAKKVGNGAAAYAATDLPEATGTHWRSYGRILELGGETALRDDVWAQWFFDPPTRLVVDPVPYSG